MTIQAGTAIAETSKAVPPSRRPFRLGGGRWGLGVYAVLAFLKQHVEVRIGNVEWPAYLDILTQTACSWRVVPFTRENGFHPANAARFSDGWVRVARPPEVRAGRPRGSSAGDGFADKRSAP